MKGIPQGDLVRRSRKEEVGWGQFQCLGAGWASQGRVAVCVSTELGDDLCSIAKAGHWSWGSASKEAPGSALKIQKQMVVAHLLVSQDTPTSPEGSFIWWKYLGSLAYLLSCSFFPSLSPNVREEEGERERGVP